jgi:hypothetical protein
MLQVFAGTDFVFLLGTFQQTFRKRHGNFLPHNPGFSPPLGISLTCSLESLLQTRNHSITYKWIFKGKSVKQNTHLFQKKKKKNIEAEIIPPVTCPSPLKLNSKNLANLLELSFIIVLAFPKLSNSGFT